MPIEISDRPTRTPRPNSAFNDAYGRALRCTKCDSLMGPHSACPQKGCDGEVHWPPDPASIAGHEAFKTHVLGVDGNGCSKCMATYLSGVLAMEVLVPALEGLAASLPDQPLVARALTAARRLLQKGM